MVMGLLCVILPAFWGEIPRLHDAPLFPVLRTAVENMQILPTLILMFFLGGIAGFISPDKWPILGVFAGAGLPMATVFEVIVAPSSHNLWPIEIAFYWSLGLASLCGAFLGAVVAKRRRARNRKTVGPQS